MALEATSIVVLAVALAALLLIANSLRSRNNSWAKTNIPQPPSWPIIGHLPLLSRSKQPIHRFISSLSERYGPIMYLQLGFRPVLVIASSDLAKECFTANDKAFASRPSISAGKHMGQNRLLQAGTHVGNFRSHTFAVGEYTARFESSEHQVKALRSHI
ncbi:xanthotoxin 5-hydroxylase CYP82C4-like [Cryptomeria japonica]|uniref:xanthotoxin 5-hydroxylase CYP82C4-like n=1 Tax=Cryptomeria japonica TaxID=3369 RepID=UPI0027DA36E4|nr:xanthotoxin 5-hydroxylase CYP82C4-like [Cryptomeria japonica]